jgi:hypothetical protein
MILSLSNRSSENKQYAKIDNNLLYDHFLKCSEDFSKESEHELYCKSLVNVDIQKTIGKFKNNYGISPQNPNIQISLDLNEENSFWDYVIAKDDDETKIEKINGQNKEIANLLLNIVPEDFSSINNKKQINNVRIPELLRDKNGLLKNIAWDNRLFITIYRQISIIIQNKNNKPEIPFIHRSILDAVELLHTRWYFNIIMNALLDEEIDNISFTDSDKNIDNLRKLINKRKLFAYFLHNQIPYRFWGGSVTDLINIAEKNMWLDKLKEMTYKKFQIIDQLIEDQLQYNKLSSYRKLYKDENYKRRLEDAYKKLNNMIE